MSSRTDSAARILDVAERMARQGGYNGFSYREIAKEIGIKAASVHYHFPTKEDLGVALTKRYSDRFLNALGNPTAYGSADAALQRFTELFRIALLEHKLMCLCGVLAAEADNLPAPVAKEARGFFEATLTWLTEALQSDGTGVERARAKAVQVLASFEGALILARSLEDATIFDTVAERLLD